MLRKTKLLMLAAGASFLMLAPMAPRAAAAPPPRHVVVVRGFYGGFYPGWYGWYGPGGYGPYWGPRYYGANAGRVKIETKLKGNSIYIDGGFAGVTGKLKKFVLRPGNHDVVVRDRSGRAFYQERLHIIPGKTIKIQLDQSS